MLVDDPHDRFVIPTLGYLHPPLAAVDISVAKPTVF